MKKAMLYLAVLARCARADKLSRTYVYLPDGW
ncbi:MAG TPA: cittilin family RiPP precursor [Longimicrobium sp.]|nr:cittilin family RiPP precursor [Longimicrobium sp.]